MKIPYNLHWFIFGLGIFWLTHLFAWASEMTPDPKWFVNILPLFCWGVFSLFELLDKKYKIFRKNEK